MQKPDRSSFSVEDLYEWYSTGKLSLAPKFQRRAVWNNKARAYLIDTILLDMPIPPIYIRIVQSDKKDKVVKEIIDGQQRLLAVFEFLDGKFSLSKGMESSPSSLKFEKMNIDEQNKIKAYTFICEVFNGISDDEVLNLFSRLNVYSVKLSDQELRHGQYFGLFRQVVYTISLQYLEFWRKAKLFSEQAIARMLEAEFVSELLILSIDGPQDKKNSINQFYDAYDESFPEKNQIVNRYENVMSIISDSAFEDISKTEFHRPPLFYALYAAIYHHLYGLDKVDIKSPKTGKIGPNDKERIREAIMNLSSIIEQGKLEEDIPKKYLPLIQACVQQTDNIKPRLVRIKFIYQAIFER